MTRRSFSLITSRLLLGAGDHAHDPLLELLLADLALARAGREQGRPRCPDLADRRTARRRDRRFIGAEIATLIDQHAAVHHDLIDVGAVGERDQRAAWVEQRLKMRMGEIDDGEIGGRAGLDPAEIRPIDDVGGDCRIRFDQLRRARDIGAG